MCTEVSSITQNVTKNNVLSTEKSNKDLLLIESLQGNVSDIPNAYSSSSNFSDNSALWPSIVSKEIKNYFIEKKKNQNISKIETPRKICADKSHHKST